MPALRAVGHCGRTAIHAVALAAILVISFNIGGVAGSSAVKATPRVIRPLLNAASAEATVLAPATRLNPPSPTTVSEAPLAPVAPVINKSNCRADLNSPTLTITIPAISYSCPVYAGGQALIDQGAVTLVTAAGASPFFAVRPGAPGTLWIAAHRSSHGGAFEAVPSLPDGSVVEVSDGVNEGTYRIVGRAYVRVRDGKVVDSSGQATSTATLESITRADRGGDLAPRLVLQTCEGEEFRWMIYGDLITT